MIRSGEDPPEIRLSVADARLIVISRDGGCIALTVDPRAGPCFDRWGLPLTKYGGPNDLEMDRIRDEAMMGLSPSHEDPTRMVALCPGHHRGMGWRAGFIWATKKESRFLLRKYLEKMSDRTLQMIEAM